MLVPTEPKLNSIVALSPISKTPQTCWAIETIITWRCVWGFCTHNCKRSTRFRMRRFLTRWWSMMWLTGRKIADYWKNLAKKHLRSFFSI